MTHALERTVNRYYDPSTDQFLSIDPDVATTDQPFVFTNDNPLNSSDPLGLKGWYCIDGQTHYYEGNKYGVTGNGKCRNVTTTGIIPTRKAPNGGANGAPASGTNSHPAPQPTKLIPVTEVPSQEANHPNTLNLVGACDVFSVVGGSGLAVSGGAMMEGGSAIIDSAAAASAPITGGVSLVVAGAIAFGAGLYTFLNGASGGAVPGFCPKG